MPPKPRNPRGGKKKKPNSPNTAAVTEAGGKDGVGERNLSPPLVVAVHGGDGLNTTVISGTCFNETGTPSGTTTSSHGDETSAKSSSKDLPPFPTIAVVAACFLISLKRKKNKTGKGRRRRKMNTPN